MERAFFSREKLPQRQDQTMNKVFRMAALWNFRIFRLHSGQFMSTLLTGSSPFYQNLAPVQAHFGNGHTGGADHLSHFS